MNGVKMDLKIVVTNGIGYLKHPIPPATYQVELIHLADSLTVKPECTKIHRNASQITIDSDHPIVKYNPNEMGLSIAILQERMAEEPMTNLLYLSLCCAKSVGKRKETECENSFLNLCPYLEQYIYAKSFGKRGNFGPVRLEEPEDMFHYRLVLDDYIKTERKVKEGILIIRDVPSD